MDSYFRCYNEERRVRCCWYQCYGDGAVVPAICLARCTCSCQGRCPRSYRYATESAHADRPTSCNIQYSSSKCDQKCLYSSIVRSEIIPRDCACGAESPPAVRAYGKIAIFPYALTAGGDSLKWAFQNFVATLVIDDSCHNIESRL